MNEFNEAGTDDWPTAVGAYIFAGGFTLGVKQYFQVLCHLEETDYGVATMRHNQPEIPVYVGSKNWPLDELRGHEIDLVYGNPPCAAWSPAGNRPGKDWREDPRVELTRRHFTLLEELRPRAWVWESVVRAFTTGRELVDQLTNGAVQLGYHVTYLLHDARYLGVPQKRPRFFFIAHRDQLMLEEPDWDEEITIAEALSSLDDPGEAMKGLEIYEKIIPGIPPGGSLKERWEQCNPEKTRKLTKQGTVKDRPSFGIKRLKENEVSGTVAGYLMIHPTESRTLSMREMMVLSGFPLTYSWHGSQHNKLLARNVCPPVGAWLARQVINGLGQSETAEWVREIDWRRPSYTKVREEASTTKAPQPKPKTVVEQTIATTPQDAPAPIKHEGSGAYLRRLIVLDRYTDEEMVALVHAHYAGRRTTISDVGYNRNVLKKEGVNPPARRRVSDQVASTPWLDQEEEILLVSQPIRKSKLPAHVDPNRQSDQSSLRETTCGRRVHRDYGAHFFRWGFAGRFIDTKTEVLDVGCGPDCSMIHVLSHPRSLVPKRYVGVDLNRAPKKSPSRKWAKLYWEFDFLTRYEELGQFDLVTCFEVLEHMHRPNGLKLLKGLLTCLKPTGILLLSTPVFNGKAAANHLHEWGLDELHEVLKIIGFKTMRRFGTFASLNVLKRVADPMDYALLERLSSYYSNEVLSCFLAPLYPDASRNNMWLLKRDDAP